jgi:hypothetical protein
VPFYIFKGVVTFRVFFCWKVEMTKYRRIMCDVCALCHILHVMAIINLLLAKQVCDAHNVQNHEMQPSCWFVTNVLEDDIRVALHHLSLKKTKEVLMSNSTIQTPLNGSFLLPYMQRLNTIIKIMS